MEGSKDIVSSVEWYQEILKKNGISDKIERITFQDADTKADGFASVAQCVTVEFNPEYERPPLRLFVKVHTVDNPAHEQFISEWRAFETESEFFMEYLPIAQKLCEQKGLNGLMDIYPKCYYADTNIVVLENLVLEKGYKMHARDKRHDFEMTNLAMKSMAKNHAVSYAVVEELGGEKKFLERFTNLEFDTWLTPSLLDMFEIYFENSVTTSITIMEKNLQLLHGKETVDKLKSLKGKSRQMNMESLEYNKSDKLRVLSHGDFKNNNMMFRKSQSSKEGLDHIIIDFQMTSYNSPAQDLMFYLFTSVDPKIRQTRLYELLDTYLVNFNKFCESLGHPASLSREELLMQFKRKLDYGMWNALILIGPGMALFKDIDVTKLTKDETANLYNKKLIIWIDQHPKEGKAMAQEIVDLLQEYETLSQNL